MSITSWAQNDLSCRRALKPQQTNKGLVPGFRGRSRLRLDAGRVLRQRHLPIIDVAAVGIWPCELATLAVGFKNVYFTVAVVCIDFVIC